MIWKLSIVSSLSLYSILVQRACNDLAWLTSECSVKCSVKVGDTRELQSRMVPPKKTGSSHLKVWTPDWRAVLEYRTYQALIKFRKQLRIFRTHRSSYKSKHAVCLICAFVGLHTPRQARSNVNFEILNFRYSFQLVTT